MELVSYACATLSDDAPVRGPMDRALALLQVRLRQEGQTLDAAVEELCVQNPDLRDEFRELRQCYLAAQTTAGLPSFRSITREILGEGGTLTIALEDESERERSTPDAPDAKVTFGRYVFQGEAARGGMGVIYRVRDSELQRTLAMKVMSIAPGASGSTVPALNRFIEEALVTAQLDHPGIVPVHELGLDPEKRPYFTMKLIRGREFSKIADLARTHEEGWNLPRAVGVLVKVCQALAFAHARRVVHRDIKPANVMVGRFGEVYLMDWGLAKVMGLQDLHDLRVAPTPQVTEIQSGRGQDSTTAESPLITMDGSVVGTPAFMPPEQARGNVEEVDRRSDIYSLGACLYHLLCGHPPFVEPDAKVSPRTILARVLDGPPKPIARLNPQAAPELVAICEKAMAREKTARYASALDVAEDLQAWLDHRVVRAYRTGPVAEFKSWVNRNRLAAAVGAGAIGVLLLIAGGWTYKEHASALRVRHQLARQYLRQGQALAEAGRIDKGLHWFVRALRDCPPSSQALKEAIAVNFSAWSARCNRFLQVFDHEGKLAATGVGPQRLAIAYDPSGTRLVTGGFYDHAARIWSLETGEQLGQAMLHESPIDEVFCTLSQRVITRTAAGSVQLWGPAGEAIGEPLASNAVSVAFNQEHSLLAVGAEDGTVTVWAIDTAQRIGEPLRHEGGGFSDIAFTSDGSRLMAGTWQGAAYVWSMSAFTPQRPPIRDLEGKVVAFSPDGKRMLVVDDHYHRRLWSMENGQPVGAPLPAAQAIDTAVFSPDGKLLATSSFQVVRVWSASDGTSIGAPIVVGTSLVMLTFSPDSQLLLTAGNDLSARLWSTATGQQVGVEIVRESPVRSFAFSPAGKTFAICNAGKAEIWSADVQPAPVKTFAAKGNVWGVDFSSEGSKVLLSTGQDNRSGMITIWEKDNNQLLMELAPPGGPWVWFAKFDPQSRFIVSSAARAAHLWTRNGQYLCELPHKQNTRCAAFDPTGRFVATGSFDGAAKVWTLPEGKSVCTFPHPQVVEDLSFNHEGTVLLTACGDGKVRFWSLETRTEARAPLIHNDSVLALKVSPDGRLIATGSRDQTARLWDARTGARVGPNLDHAYWVEDLAFSPNGQFLVTGCADGNVQLWSVSSGERIGPPFPQPYPARAVAFDPDGAHILVGTEDPAGKAMLWAVPHYGPVVSADLDLRAQAQTGERMDQDGVLSRLSASEWQAIRQQINPQRN